MTDAAAIHNGLPRRTVPRDEDLVLVRRLLARDESAWREFLQRFRNLILHRIHAAARELGLPIPQTDLAEDVCADVFSSLLSRDMDSLRRFEGRSRLSTWLTVVVRRIAIRSLTRRARQPRQPDTGEFDRIPWPDSPTPNAAWDSGQRLEAALTRLSDDDRAVLILFYRQRRSYAEIGEQLGITENAVGPKLHRARSRLKSLMTGDDDSSTCGRHPP